MKLDSYLKFEKWLEGDEVGVEHYHQNNSVIKEARKISDAEKLKRHLVTNNIDGFFKEIQSVFSDLPYLIYKSKEGYFHSHIHLLLRMLGFDISSEVSTNIGRIDSVLELENTIYLIEFKIGEPSRAINQIKEKKYFQKYQTSSKDLVMIGVGCSVKERNLGYPFKAGQIAIDFLF